LTKPLELVKKIVAAMEDKKAHNISVLDLQQVSLVADYFVIATGNSSTQVKAICDHVEEELGTAPLRKEGYKDANWVLLDYNYVVIHIFQEDTRCFYDLERLWGDARQVKIG
jgi:ribosome-associated protein